MARSREGHEDILVIDLPKERLFEDKGRRVHGSPFLAQELHKKSFNINEIKQAVEKAGLQSLKFRSDK